jgi:hypothetical protein
MYKYIEEVIDRSPDIEEVKPEKAVNKKGRRRIYREEQAISLRFGNLYSPYSTCPNILLSGPTYYLGVLGSCPGLSQTQGMRCLLSLEVVVLE